RRLTLSWVLAALVISTAGCGSHIGTTAASFLRRIREDADPNMRYLAYAKLGSPNCYDSESQKDEAARVLIDRLEKGKEPVASRAVICKTLGFLARPLARDAILKAVRDPEAVVRVEACRALGTVGKTEDATVLARIMATDTLEDCRVAAVEALGALRPDDPRIARVLAEGMVQPDPAIRLASVKALRAITGQDLGLEPGPWMELVARLEGGQVAPGSGEGPGSPESSAPGEDLPIVLAPSSTATGRDPSAKAASYPPEVPPYRLPGEDR
ncbi:MAG: HEAT repeat domain-containing protein, partial [Isosphaeraceae bacterium]